jgi:putative nucleotidyltransferase with HDIG domain
MGIMRKFGSGAFVASIAALAGFCLFVAVPSAQPNDNVKFVCYLTAALLASPLKVGLPGIEGTLSVNYLFTMLGVLELSLPQTLFIGLGSTLVQSFWKATRRPLPIQLLFNLSQVTVSSVAAYAVYALVATRVPRGAGPLALLAAAITHYACNTAAMATIIGLTAEKPISKVWSDSYLWSFPYYMGAAAVAGLVSFLNRHIGWQSSLLVLPPIYLMYRSYRLYLGKLDAERLHAQKISSLHLRTIEALALAIGAKDNTTGEHLQRVRVYAMEVARELNLSDDEIEALRAASVLHDIGKLAVPEHIISKPGKLTPEEFEKMKIHPVVGAEILEQVDFPYPVVPIVRAHHEKWDGSGYPSGLQAEEIPIGARILSAVDCLDALASDRQYRKALPLDEAMAKVASESGTSFDPQVVRILERRYVELEKMAKEHPVTAAPSLSTDIKIKRGAAPAAGFAEEENPVAGIAPPADSDAALRNAVAEEQELFELLRQNRAVLGMDDIFSLLAVRLKRLIPHESMAVYALHDDCLLPQWVSGDHFRRFYSLKIPLGEGVCGWVAQNNKPIVNGNPAVEPGFSQTALAATAAPASLPSDPVPASVLAVPIETSLGANAVVALYRTPQGAFTRQDLQTVETLTARIGFALDEVRSLSQAASASH